MACRWQNLVATAVVALCAAIYLAYAVRAGLPVGEATKALAAVGLLQVLPGALLWRSVRPPKGWLLEDLAMGFALGFALAVPIQVVAGLSGQRWTAFALPLAVVVTLLGLPRTRRRIRSATWAPVAWWLAPAVSLLSFWAVQQLVSYFRTNQVTWEGLGRPHVDLLFHQAMATQLLHRGPTGWPLVAGEDLSYHWFGYSWMAHVSATSGVGLDLVLLRLTPALMPLLVAVCVMVAALRLSRSSKVALLATFLAMCASAGNPFGSPSMSLPVNPDSPTLALGVPTLLALVILLDQRWRGELSRSAYLLVPLLAVIAAGTKGATSPLVVAGLGLAVVAMALWNRPLFGRVMLDLAMVAGGLLFTLFVVFHGSSAGLHLGVEEAAEQTYSFTLLQLLPDTRFVIAAVVLAVLGGLSRAALAFVPLVGRRTRTQPMYWLLAGGALAGAGAVGVFSHPGRSQYYFLSTAIPLAAIGSAMGAQALVGVLGRHTVARLLPLAIAAGAAIHVVPTRLVGSVTAGGFHQFWSVLAVVLVILGAVGAAAFLLADPGVRWRSALGTVATAGLFLAVFTSLNAVKAPLFPPVKATVSLKQPLAVSQHQIDTARYIRDHSRVDDLVMTNRHCTVVRAPFGGCDSRRWVVTAYSERQSLVEGWAYTARAATLAPNGRDSITVDYWKPEILRLNDGFIAAPTGDARQRLWDLGVRWVYVDRLMPHAQTLEPFATLRHDTPDATAWQLVAP